MGRIAFVPFDDGRLVSCGPGNIHLWRLRRAYSIMLYYIILYYIILYYIIYGRLVSCGPAAFGSGASGACMLILERFVIQRRNMIITMI